jgi:hypothetical protein
MHGSMKVKFIVHLHVANTFLHKSQHLVVRTTELCVVVANTSSFSIIIAKLMLC